MDWNKILEQAIIGGLMGGLAYLFSKSLNYYKRKTIKIDKKAIKEDYEKDKSKINIPKIKIPSKKSISELEKLKVTPDFMPLVGPIIFSLLVILLLLFKMYG